MFKKPPANFSAKDVETLRTFNMNFPKTDYVSFIEHDVFELGLKAFDQREFLIATQCFAKLVLHRDDFGMYQMNKLICEFLSNEQKMPRDFLIEFLSLQVRNKFNIFWDRLDMPFLGLAPYPAMVYDLCLLLRLISREDLEPLVYVIERMQRTGNPIELTDSLLSKSDALAIDVLVKVGEYKVAYDEILRAEREYPTLEPSVLIKFQQLKIRCMVALKNFQTIKKEYKTLFALTRSDHPSYHVGSFIKAEHEYLVNNFKKAFKTMESFTTKYPTAEQKEEFFRLTGDNIGMMIKNNQACCDFNVYKPATALWRLREAHEEFSLHTNLRDYPAYCYDKSQQLEVLNYNKAIALLYTHQYKEAIPLLMKSCRAFPSNPRLWLRLGQACMGVTSPLFEDMHVTPRKLLQGIRELMASGKLDTIVYVDTVHDRIIELPIIRKLVKFNPKTIFPASSYARICAKLALENFRAHVEQGKTIKVCPSNPMYDRRCRNTLRAEILSFMTHQCMRFGCYHEAFTYAMELLAIENIPGELRYLAKADIGEAATKLRDARRAEPFIEDDDDIAEMLERPASRIGSAAGESCQFILKPTEDLWCRSAYWLEAHRAISQIVYKTKTMYFPEALDQAREWIKILGDEIPFPLFSISMFLFKITGCLDEAYDLWHKNIGQFYPQYRNVTIKRRFKKLQKQELPEPPKIYSTPRKLPPRAPRPPRKKVDKKTVRKK